MSKAARAVKNVKKSLVKVNHGNKVKTNIPAGLASPGPPLGPMLGQVGLNIAAFCKDFNEKTKDIKEGIPLPTRITVNPDRSYNLTINKPPTTFFLKQAAGIQRCSMEPGKEVCGKITLKHLYEIAKIKSTDSVNECLSLEDLCRKFVGIAHSCGIEIVKELDSNEYQQFLQHRKKVVDDQKKELQEKREAKMLRTG
ncbi:large ribosomal subunit protein uL11m [Halyomorpha halys]|uniref:large ribosomal subunit protein uL11m n=1 Tax=Halyomorpha halys TaxID=286706 RepID=UPI0006D4ED62|nr:39S ribosomal protein L11, mitochondrial [Halyomorpha halys]